MVFFAIMWSAIEARFLPAVFFCWVAVFCVGEVGIEPTVALAVRSTVCCPAIGTSLPLYMLVFRRLAYSMYGYVVVGVYTYIGGYFHGSSYHFFRTKFRCMLFEGKGGSMSIVTS